MSTQPKPQPQPKPKPKPKPQPQPQPQPKEPIMADWYKWSETFNKFAGFATIGLGVLWWFLAGFSFFGLWNPISGLLYLILCVTAGVLYLIMVQKKVADKDQTKMTHIWLLITTCVGFAGIFIPLIFLFYGIFSDKPFWEAFGE